ncbi:mucoidy inhibitor MuiA family protein [Kitasatospora sp. NPDC002227]|uniref:mucoidy inhibitor MuiA family protein n=1 Tax=Kitasatospora sp. NPDC002227 TaxID=3154773 RepID=UPI003332769B
MTTTPPLPALTGLPVTAVTCLEDRALVERVLRLPLTAGVQRLKLGPVTALAVDHSLRADFPPGSAAQVLEARLVRAWAPRPPLPPGQGDSELRHRVHALELEERAQSDRAQRLEARLALLAQLGADLLREIGEGAGHGELEPARWARELDRVDTERETHGERLRACRARLRTVETELAEARRALELTEEEPPELTAYVELAVAAEEAGPAELTVSHLTPCALWRPAYRATLTEGRLRLETDAMVWQRTGEDWPAVRLTFSTARSSLAAEPPQLLPDVLTLRERSAGERKVVEVELREEAVGDTGPAQTGLPGVDDGGEVRVMTAGQPATVPGDGRPHRVPLGEFSTAASSEYVCAPELSPLVSQVVRFRSEAAYALLAGPVDLILGSGFAGRGELPFTAPGATAELSFGSSDSYRVVRETEETRATTGLTQRSTVTRTVRLHLSRFSGPAEREERLVTLRERVPVSEVAEVEVRLRKELCSPAPDELDADGICRWSVPLPPGGRRTVTLAYEISAAAKVAGL